MSSLLETAMRVESKLTDTIQLLASMTDITRRLTMAPLSAANRKLVADALRQLDHNFSTDGFKAGLAALRDLEGLING